LPLRAEAAVTAYLHVHLTEPRVAELEKSMDSKTRSFFRKLKKKMGLLPRIKAQLLKHLHVVQEADDATTWLSIVRALQFFYKTVPGNFEKQWAVGKHDLHQEERTHEPIIVIGGDGRLTEKDEWSLAIRLLEVVGMVEKQSPDSWLPIGLISGTIVTVGFSATR
jgi:hypothetical protein